MFDISFAKIDASIKVVSKQQRCQNMWCRAFHQMMHQLEQSKYDLIQKVVAIYCNHNESFDKFITHAVRELVLIHPIDELHLMVELGYIASTNGVTIAIKTTQLIHFCCVVGECRVSFTRL